VNRPDEAILCTCFGGGNGNDMTEKIILIKGPFCFVFNKESDPAPKYAIGAAHMKPVMHAPQSQKSQSVVTIETALGDVEWEIRFDKENIAKQFVESFRQQAAIGESDEARKVRLGILCVFRSISSPPPYDDKASMIWFDAFSRNCSKTHICYLLFLRSCFFEKNSM
jgi:hypothetical protein